MKKKTYRRIKMRRQQQTFLVGSVEDTMSVEASTTRIIASDGTIKTLEGTNGINVVPSTSPQSRLVVSMNTEWQQKLNALIASPLLTADTDTVRLPYEQSGDVTTVVTNGTIIFMPVSNGTLTLDGTPSNTMSVGYQWLIVNTHPTSSVVVASGMPWQCHDSTGTCDTSEAIRSRCILDHRYV
jgi:hypothetical protein